MTSKHIAIVKDGKIELLEPVSIPEGTKLLIIPMSLESDTQERESWGNWSLENLNQCYGEDEPEYSLESIKEHNPDYERR
ncbi:hypothetical protein NIES4071_11020 [Calothrix sp. NIES-4071]|nr:hypothetical protein NIES4071_11020 [Calothrix sp. NIES-4071]BAZ55442.1 hypothetical protein NIES4105_10980 [Calothrix sp. NIES-4105]